MRALVVVNARARRVPASRRSELARIWGRAGEVELIVTHTAAQATAAARDGAARGCEVVAAVGGDGTLRSVAAGLVGTSTALAAVPGGTTNVVARALGLPNRPCPASALLVESLLAGRIKPIQAGWVGADHQEMFLANCGVGLDAAVVAAVEARPMLKRRLGHLWFAAAAAGVMARRPTPFEVTVVSAGRSCELRLDWLVTQAVGPYSFAGRRALTLASGEALRAGLCLVGFAHVAPLAIARRLPRALGRGVARVEDTDVIVVENVSSVSVRAPEPVPVQADGDFLGRRANLVVSTTSAALLLVVP